MDFGTWSPSHTIFVIFVAVGFIGQVAIWLYRIGQTEKRMDKQGETFFHALERLEERMDKRFVEVNQQFVEVNQQFVGLRTDMNQGFSDVRSEMNQRLSDMQAEIGDVRSEMRLLNQNHIEHLTHHNR